MPKKSNRFCKLRGRLAERGMNIKDLALQAGINAPALYHVMRGGSGWTLEAMVAVCDCLEIPINKEIRQYFLEER